MHLRHIWSLLLVNFQVQGRLVHTNTCASLRTLVICGARQLQSSRHAFWPRYMLRRLRALAHSCLEVLIIHGQHRATHWAATWGEQDDWLITCDAELRATIRISRTRLRNTALQSSRHQRLWAGTRRCHLDSLVNVIAGPHLRHAVPGLLRQHGLLCMVAAVAVAWENGPRGRSCFRCTRRWRSCMPMPARRVRSPTRRVRSPCSRRRCGRT